MGFGKFVNDGFLSEKNIRVYIFHLPNSLCRLLNIMEHVQIRYSMVPSLLYLYIDYISQGYSSSILRSDACMPTMILRSLLQIDRRNLATDLQVPDFFVQLT